MTSITIDDLPTSSLEGKIALITGLSDWRISPISSPHPLSQMDRSADDFAGGARGIGKATAEYFHSRGAHVVIGDVDETVGVAAAKEIGEYVR